MPFLDKYALESYPFSLTPDVDLYFSTIESENILSGISYAFMRGDGLLKVVGEIGTGKTLMCRVLLGRLKKSKINTAYIHAPSHCVVDDLPKLILSEFGVKSKKNELPVQTLQNYLLKEHSKGNQNILILDEAQAFGKEGLEAIRLLTNLETDKDKLLQIVLFGQDELDRLLHKHDMRQLLQRVNFGFLMKPFSVDDIDAYLHHRVERCALKTKTGRIKKGAPALFFTVKASRVIGKLSRGIPRLVHQIADKAVLAAYSRNEHTITKKHIRIALAEVEGLTPFWRIYYSLF